MEKGELNWAVIGCEIQRNLWKTSISQESRLYLCRMVHQPHRRQQSSRRYQGYEEKEPYPVCPLKNDPLAYADLILNGDPEEYLKNVTGSHRLEI